MTQVKKFIPFIIFMVLICYGLVSYSSNKASLEIGDIVNFGKFQEESILWQVVDIDGEENPLLLSKYIIDIKPFDASGDKHSPDGYYNFAQYYGSNIWETSTLRQWLNSKEKHVNWQLNAPTKDNVFKGKNSYDKESGFLYRKNFSLEQRNMILKSKTREKVFLLPFEDYLKYYNNMDFSQLFTPTKLALERSEYHNRNLKSALPYAIWTQDAVSDSPHAVTTFEAPNTKGVGVASAGYKGIAPAMYLNLNKLKSTQIYGEGTIINPYEIKGNSSNSTLISLFIVLIVIILMLWIFHKKKTILMILSLLLFSLTGCQSGEVKGVIEEYEKPKVIVLSYASQVDVIMNRLEDFFNDGNKIMIIDGNGENKTNWVRKHYKKPNTEVGIREVFEELTQNQFQVVKGGDFRVTTMKKEIDSVF